MIEISRQLTTARYAAFETHSPYNICSSATHNASDFGPEDDWTALLMTHGVIKLYESAISWSPRVALANIIKTEIDNDT